MPGKHTAGHKRPSKPVLVDREQRSTGDAGIAKNKSVRKKKERKTGEVRFVHRLALGRFSTSRAQRTE